MGMGIERYCFCYVCLYICLYFYAFKMEAKVREKDFVERKTKHIEQLLRDGMNY